MQEEPVSSGKQEAIKSRPRIYMAPAVSLDDVPDPKMRELLINEMYTTDWRRAEVEAAPSVEELKIPSSTIEWDNKPVNKYIIKTWYKC